MFGFTIVRKHKPVFPPPVPAPSRFEGESERSFKKRQDAYIQHRLRKEML